MYWSILFSGDTYKLLFDCLQSHREGMEEIEKFATWQKVFQRIESRYERIWPDAEEKRGYLNN